MSDCRCVSMSPSWWWWSHQLCVGCSGGSRGAIWWSHCWRVWGPLAVERSQPGHRSGTGSPVAPVSVWHLSCDTVTHHSVTSVTWISCSCVTLCCDVMTGRVSLSCFGYRLLQCEYQYANDVNGCFTILWGNGIVVSLQNWEITVVKLRQGSGKDRQGMAVKAKSLKA